jgi:hypothetical protein
MMIYDNSITTFTSLREKFRKEANLQILIAKSKQKTENPDQLSQTGTGGGGIALSLAKDQEGAKEDPMSSAESNWNPRSSPTENNQHFSSTRNFSAIASTTQIISKKPKSSEVEKSSLKIIRKTNFELQ